MTTITISGPPGAGTTTIAKLLQQQLQLPYVYTGEIFRTLAKEHNMNLAEFSSYAEHHPEIDQELDKKQLHILKQQHLILEGRLAGWLAYHHHIPAHKILLTATENIRANRILNREKGDLKQRKNEMIQREKSETLRYKQIYHININNPDYYDLVIDTSDKPPNQILQAILNHIQQEETQ